MTSPQELADRLEGTGYLADEDLATVVFSPASTPATSPAEPSSSS